MRIFWLVSAAALVAVVPAHADQTTEALAEVAKCADIAAAPERLSCFDKIALTAKTVLAAQPSEQVAVGATEDEDGGVLRWFGLSERKPVTKAEDFGKPPQVMSGPKEINEISSTVAEFAKNPYGRSIFILDNGQVWRQIDGDTTDVILPRSSDKLRITIEKGVLGSFDLKIEGRTGFVKVRRIK